jgi:hypothetical protein
VTVLLTKTPEPTRWYRLTVMPARGSPVAVLVILPRSPPAIGSRSKLPPLKGAPRARGIGVAAAKLVHAEGPHGMLL